MSELTTTVDEGRLVIEVSERSYPRDAVYAAAFAFIDRGWVRLDVKGEGKLTITVQPKGSKNSAEMSAGMISEMAAEMEAELAAQTLRVRAAAAARATYDDVLARAFGAPAADAASPALEDPLGIAASWEAKHDKHKEPEAP